VEDHRRQEVRPTRTLSPARVHAHTLPACTRDGANDPRLLGTVGTVSLSMASRSRRLISSTPGWLMQRRLLSAFVVLTRTTAHAHTHSIESRDGDEIVFGEGGTISLGAALPVANPEFKCKVRLPRTTLQGSCCVRSSTHQQHSFSSVYAHSYVLNPRRRSAQARARARNGGRRKQGR
jgi:hypothetical protein